MAHCPLVGNPYGIRGYTVPWVKDPGGMVGDLPLSMVPKFGPEQFGMAGHAGLVVETWPYSNKLLPAEAEPQRSFKEIE